MTQLISLEQRNTSSKSWRARKQFKRESGPEDGGREYQRYWGGDVDGKIVEDVTIFMILGALITRDGLCDKGIRRRIAMGKAAMGGLTTIWKDRRIKLATKVIPMKALVFPIVLYGAETWTVVYRVA